MQTYTFDHVFHGQFLNKDTADKSAQAIWEARYLSQGRIKNNVDLIDSITTNQDYKNLFQNATKLELPCTRDYLKNYERLTSNQVIKIQNEINQYGHILSIGQVLFRGGNGSDKFISTTLDPDIAMYHAIKNTEHDSDKNAFFDILVLKTEGIKFLLHGESDFEHELEFLISNFSFGKELFAIQSLPNITVRLIELIFNPV
ncbi:hypothetical protein CWB85_19690 [Pseudoalteromonas sp. S1727]|uniref:hypothetical protein n=1 Tax=Pseudoalteromonas sp. S1727 TaxID=2066514 RepID=UPI001109783D|nr:hypothetical protein [Pseudoalteromonas sp. S1727]TMN67274.1 hypothetical protein CWB85_19690 [Pseudoalteromonas sp. S1727]